jgi:hypothetical protein
MNSLNSWGFPLKNLGINCTALGTDLYLFERGPSLLLTDMTDFSTLGIRAYLRKNIRKSGCSSELTKHHPPIRAPAPVPWYGCFEAEGGSSRGAPNRSQVGQCFLGSPEISVRCVLE